MSPSNAVAAMEEARSLWRTENNNMEPIEKAETPVQLPAGEGVDQSIGQTSINQHRAQSHHSSGQDQRQSRLATDDWELQQATSLRLEFQDSNLSPALSLLPGVEHNITEYSFFQQSDVEFAPLRAHPDISVASEKFLRPAQDRIAQASEHGPLSQHPLTEETALSEDSCSLSQHSLSPADEGRQKEMEYSSQQIQSRENMSRKEMDTQTLTGPVDKPVDQAEDDTFFLSKDVPAQHLLELLQKDVGMPSGSSSAVSSGSEISLKRAGAFSGESKSAKVCKAGIEQSTVRREVPPGEASLTQKQTLQPQRDSSPDQTSALLSEVPNITMGSRSTQPDDSSEALHKELLSEVERHRCWEAETNRQPQGRPTPPEKSLTPCPTESSEGKTSEIGAKLVGVLGTGPRFSGSYTVERGHRERDLWSSGNQTGVDGSYLGFLPQSQSTPGVFKPPVKSSVKTPLGQLSAIESSKENSYQSSTRISAQPAVPVADVRTASLDADRSGTENPCQQETTSAKVQSLPSLNYIQKVDAWRANQSLGKTSLFDSLALQGFSGISPKKKAYDAVSDSLNRILSEQVRSLHQPPVSSAAMQSFSAARSGPSSPRRGEAVGSAPSDKDDTSAAWPSASPFGRSQSHSSLSTVVPSAQKAEHAERPAEMESSQTGEEDVPQQPLPLTSLGQFSDVSFDDVTLSNSQGSYNSGKNLGTSVGASSVSLEVDNYAPYWTAKIITPPPPPKPRPRELNIEERIPLYLHNLGIDQSPSTILTPFAPRGPIREPEFSPTDLCTIKGSIGTPTKSALPSEGGSPHKGEFSRCSVLSVDSSISIPLSVDSLCPAVSLPEPTRASTTDPAHSQRLASAQPDETSRLSAPQTNQQQQRESHFISSKNTIHLRDKVESDSSLIKEDRCWERNFESALQESQSTKQSTEGSSFNSKPLSEIRNLLGQAQNIVSAQSSLISSASPAAPRLLSDDDIFLSQRSKLQDSSFTSSSANGDPRTRSSLLWARSSSDSVLTSEKPSSAGRQSMTSSGQPDNLSTQALTTGQYLKPQENMVNRSLGLSLVLSKSSRRAEPEGCSAALPDNAGPAQPPVIRSAMAVRPPQPTSSPAETAAAPEEEQRTEGGHVGSSSSSAIIGDADQGAMSDGSSESSLAARVIKLLQNESPGTVVSSTTSTTDQEESRAREWINLKVSGQHCEPLELDIEDRKRIEEIKRELLLNNPIKSQASTDTDSSVVSSVSVPHQPSETFTGLHGAEDQPPHQLQRLNMTLSDSTVSQLQTPLRLDLEALVQEIAVKEGITLFRSKPQALTSITIATRRRSTSPSPSISPAPPLSPAPEPLHLCQLSTGTVKQHTADRQLPLILDEEESPASAQAASREPASTSEPNSFFSKDQILLDSESVPGNQQRQDAVGGQYEEPPSSLGLVRKDVNVKDKTTQSFMGDEEFSSKHGSVSGVGFGAQQTPGSSTIDSPAKTGHVSHLHLTLSPKATDDSLATALHSSNAAAAVPRLSHKEFVPLRHSPASSSPDEGVGLSSPPELYDTREATRGRGPERVDTSTLFKTVVPQERMTSEMSPRPSAVQTAALPVLLPYKPSGSEELFYVPQTEPDISTECSDTTMESSHPGSDDAVPPRFSSDVLGHQDPSLDRGVAIRHTEGIYSKRLKTAFKMQEQEDRGVAVAADGSSQISASPAPQPPSQVSVSFTRLPLSDPSSSRRDQGTSPVHFLSYVQTEASSEAFRPVHMERNYSKASHHPSTRPDQSSVPQGEEQDPAIAQPASPQSSSTLDQLWHRFCERRSLEETCPASNREVSLLERLERLSRLIHGTRATGLSELQDGAYPRPYVTEEKQGRRGEDAALMRKERKENIEEIEPRDVGSKADRKVRGSGKDGSKPSIPRQAWTQMSQVKETLHPAEDGHTFSSTHSQNSSQSQHLCPAERDESETSLSGSMSTVDTARLIRAFGTVQQLKPTSSLSKLYSTISRQKEGMEDRRGRGKHKDRPCIITPSETTVTDESLVTVDSASSTSTYTLPSRCGPSRSLTMKKAVKLVSKGIQAGDLEIVSNGTRRHTRDVGTTFPSPGETRPSRQISSSPSSIERGRGGQKSLATTQGFLKPRKSKRTPPKSYPEAISWFIPAEHPRAEARKENQPEEKEPTWRPSTSWFEPYSRTNPWREPLRQRQVQEDRNKPKTFRHAEPDPDPGSKTVSSGLARISLQEALEMHRPQFLSRSRQRVTRLALQMEERKLQAVFSRERDELFNRVGGPRRLQKPAGTLRRAVPRREMIQRSKQIYENLPEVQRRREEERRKAEYRSYRLNAQLYNKRITSRVLGRRAAWQ
ncbi:hypothetical protein LDENG_00116820 [Lucifuga dentata]|nr:hypothetical protein LDENG_00116820 [Lucifuga dentata]